jgi:hypothetical protein
MYRWIFVVLGLLAFVYASPAWSIVQETNTTVTSTVPELKKTVIKIEQTGQATQTVTVTGKSSARKRIKIDTEKPVKVTVTVDDKPVKEVTVEGGAFLQRGVDLGIPGLTLQNTVPRTTAYVPAAGQPTTPAVYRGVRAPNVEELFGGWGVDVGVTGGANVHSTGSSYIRGFDNTGGANLVDYRAVDLGGTSGFLGAVVTTWGPGPGAFPGSHLFLQSGVNFPIDSSRSATQTGINTVPQGTATLTEKEDWQVPLFVGMSFPLSSPFNQMIPLQDQRWRLGGGGIFTHGSISLSGTDGPARVPFSVSNDYTRFDWGLLGGFRGKTAGNWILGADLMVTFRGDESLTVGSNVFPGQSYTGNSGNDTQLTFMFSISRHLFGTDSGPMRSSAVMSDVRLKHDIVRVGSLDNGLSLYRYRYLWSDTEYVGVMAQEVALIRADAVEHGEDGYLRVNYARLGLRLQTWGEWRATH